MANPNYTLYHPKWYRQVVSVWWWLESWRFAKFVLRELTSLFVALFAVVCLWQLRALVHGPAGYAQFLERLRSPTFLVLNALTFAAVLFHALTWFHLAPKAMTVRIGGRRVPDSMIVALNYAAWLVASGAVAWVLLRG